MRPRVAARCGGAEGRGEEGQTTARETKVRGAGQVGGRAMLHTGAANDDWGAWLNYATPARGFFSATERRGHITLKELAGRRAQVDPVV